MKCEDRVLGRRGGASPAAASRQTSHLMRGLRGLQAESILNVTSVTGKIDGQSIRNLLIQSRLCESSLIGKGLQLRTDQFCRSRLYIWGITKSGDPADFWFATKPSHLPLGIIAVSLLNRDDRVRLGELPF